MKTTARTILAATVATLLPLLFPFPASAQTSAVWNSTAGNWSDLARWGTNPFFPNNGNPAGVTYDAVINGGGVNLDVPITIENLFLNGGAFSSASNQTLTLNQKFRWTGGTVGGARLRLPAGW